jgi:hypothetical protein
MYQRNKSWQNHDQTQNIKNLFQQDDSKEPKGLRDNL